MFSDLPHQRERDVKEKRRGDPKEGETGEAILIFVNADKISCFEYN